MIVNYSSTHLVILCTLLLLFCLLCIHRSPVITSVQKLIGNCFYISLCRSADTSRSAHRILPYEGILNYMMLSYMQELNAVVLIVVIFVPSQFLLASVLLILQCLSGMLLASFPGKTSILQETDAYNQL